MNRILNLILQILTAMSVMVTRSEAKEGYANYSDQAPQAVSLIWNSVFYVIAGDPTDFVFGTASLINVQPNGDSAELFFITNNHVVRDRCPALGFCKGLELGQDLKITFGEKETKINYRYGLRFAKVEVYNRSLNPDLALLKVDVRLSELKIPRVLKIPTECPKPIAGQKLSSVAFPQMVIRDARIQETFKRWSEGAFLKNELFASKLYHGTTVDLLSGGSGSPVVDENGQLFGIMARSSSVAENQFQYVGSEVSGRPEYQSLVIPCEIVRKFIYGN